MPKLEPESNESAEQYMQRCMADPTMQELPEMERKVQCQIMFDQKGTSNQTAQAPAYDATRRIGFDTSALDAKAIVDDDKYLVVPAVIASEIVHRYEDGYAYKPAEELEKMAAYAADVGAVPIKVLDHPGADTNYLLLRQGDMHGRAENFQFVKNLRDPKTGRPMRRGVKADIRWFKNRVDADVIEKIRSGTLHDVSIGFTFDSDKSPGEFQGQHYDYVQRNIFLNHVAAPIEAGRCPGPICGIGYDSKTMIQLDAKALAECPVCTRIQSVGFATAGHRLYSAYGPDVLEVIEGHDLPPTPKQSPTPAPAASSIDVDFARVFKELNDRLKN